MESCSASHEPNEAIQAFDTLYTTNHMQMLKLLFPYLDYENQVKLAVYIKWQELMFALRFRDASCSAGYSAALYSPDFQYKKDLNFSQILPSLFPLCTENEKSILSRFSGIQNMMEMYRNMMEYMPFIQQMMEAMNAASTASDSGTSTGAFPNAFSGLTGGFPDLSSLMGGMDMDALMNMVSNLMSPEQMEMFSAFME